VAFALLSLCTIERHRQHGHSLFALMNGLPANTPHVVVYTEARLRVNTHKHTHCHPIVEHGASLDLVTHMISNATYVAPWIGEMYGTRRSARY